MIQQLPKTWKMPAEVSRAFGGRIQEQRALFEGGHLVLVVHRLEGEGRDPVVFWRSPDGAWKCTAGGKAVPMMHLILDEYADRATKLHGQLEKATVARHFFDVLAALRPLEHTASEMAMVLSRACRLVPGEDDVERWWMRARAIARRFQLLVARAEDGRDYDLAQLNEEQADISNQMVVSSQRLNFLIAMLLPMTALTSIFGMNLFNGVEEGASSALFWAVVMVSVLAGAALSFFIGRMPRQLRRESHLEALIEQVEAEVQARRR
jgi:hypothetical protein